jgi:hypothetical protein
MVSGQLIVRIPPRFLPWQSGWVNVNSVGVFIDGQGNRMKNCLHTMGYEWGL